MMRKIKIIIACWATVIVETIIVSLIFVLLEMEDKLESFFYLNFTVGAAFIFLLFWPFYSKRMK